MIFDRIFRISIMPHANGTQYGIHIAYRIFYKAGLSSLVFLILALVSLGCTAKPPPYRPPASTIQSTRLAIASAAPSLTLQPIETKQPTKTPQPTATQACTDNLTFLESVSISDGTVVQPGGTVDKRWLVQNSGSCNWDERYLLKITSGTTLNAPQELALYPARSGTKANLRIVFTAPNEPGSYQAIWQACSPQGQPFGDPLTVMFVVAARSP